MAAIDLVQQSSIAAGLAQNRLKFLAGIAVILLVARSARAQ